LSFDGISDYVSAAVDVSENSYTASLWFKTTASNTGMYAVVDTDLGGSHDRHLYLTSGNAATRVWNNQTIASTGKNFADGQWHNLVHAFGSDLGGQRQVWLLRSRPSERPWGRIPLRRHGRANHGCRRRNRTWSYHI
jgi:hypothetical protein